MEKIKLLLDTDLGADCDDAGALALLHRMSDMGKAEILSVTHCGSEISGAVSVKAINEWYNRGEIPIGRYEKTVFLEADNCVVYTKPLMEIYLSKNNMPVFENATQLLRKTLAENTDVTLVVIGMLNNIAELLKSEPDAVSPLNGVELIKSSVKNMYVMGGHYADLTYAEWNIKLDPQNAQYVARNFPQPIIFCGFEIGENILTGERLQKEPDENPVKFSYLTYLKAVGIDGVLRNSWDPITAYCAVEPDNDLFALSKGVTVDFDDEGRVLLSKGGKDKYLISKATDEEIRAVIDELIY